MATTGKRRSTSAATHEKLSEAGQKGGETTAAKRRSGTNPTPSGGTSGFGNWQVPQFINHLTPQQAYLAGLGGGGALQMMQGGRRATGTTSTRTTSRRKPSGSSGGTTTGQSGGAQTTA